MAVRVVKRRLARVALGGWMLTMAGCGGGDTGACSLALATSVPLNAELDRSKLSVPAMLDGNPLKLLVDTGAQQTVLDSRAVHQSERTGQYGTMSGVGGSRGGESAVLQSLNIGRLHGSVTVVSAAYSAELAGRGFAGLLGMNILGAYDVDVNLGGGELRFFTARGDCRRSRVGLGEPLYAVDYLDSEPGDARPHVPVVIGGEQFVGLLDTGSPGTLVSGRAARRLGLTAASLSGDRIVHGGGIGQRRVTGRMHVLDRLAIGDLAMLHVPAFVLAENFDPDVDILLGVDFAERVHLWLSNSSRRLIMQFPPAASPLTVRPAAASP